MSPGFFVFSFGVVVAGAYDAWSRRIPNRVVGPLLAAGLIESTWSGGWSGLGWSALGLLLGGGLLFVPFAKGWLGGGDVKLLAAIGAWLGPVPTLLAAGIGLAMGGLLSVAIALRHRAMGREAAVNLLGAFAGQTMPEMVRREKHHTVPLGTAFALGGIVSPLVLGGLHA